MTGSVPPADTTTPTAAAASPTNRLSATTTRIGHRVCRRCASGPQGRSSWGSGGRLRLGIVVVGGRHRWPYGGVLNAAAVQ